MRSAAAAVLLALSLVGCGGEEADIEACRAAMQAQFQRGVDPEVQRPPECQDVPEDEMERIAEDLGSELSTE